MTVRRAMGIETEYGITTPDAPHMSPMLASTLLVTAYRDSGVAWVPWDYESEDPLQDARGFHLERAAADPSLLTDIPTQLDEPIPGAAIVHGRGRPRWPRGSGPTAIALANGARLYVDHAHPEFSTPEVSSAREAALWDEAGVWIMRAAASALAETTGTRVGLYKNNTDGKGASYGTHENYLVDRAVPFADLVAFLTPYLVTRQILTGSGRVGLGQRSGDPGFQLSQRADFIEAEVGLETTLRRPIINTRDEPHSDPRRWRRLHVICGDATTMPIATYLRLGMASLVLAALEAGLGTPSFLTKVRLADPVAAFAQVSRDLTLRTLLSMDDGGHRTALDIQREYLALGEHVVAEETGEVGEARDVLAQWRRLLDQDPRACPAEVEWAAKLRVLDGLRKRLDTDWSDPRLAAADIQWTDLDPARSLSAKVAASTNEPLFTSEEIAHAIEVPPATTRAWTRGRLIAAEALAAASWDTLVTPAPRGRRPHRHPIPDPLVSDGLPEAAQGRRRS
ncbi:MAG: proteasome accessory factor PafA2 [Micrococcales bacterium]|nr:proteasome accessory factor PafA2 [Micrococcales bacterium]